jgi:hypothetical protein
LLAEFDGIAAKIDENLRQPQCVSPQRGIAGCGCHICSQRQILAERQLCNNFQHMVDHVTETKHTVIEYKLARINF